MCSGSRDSSDAELLFCSTAIIIKFNKHLAILFSLVNETFADSEGDFVFASQVGLLYESLSKMG